MALNILVVYLLDFYKGDFIMSGAVIRMMADDLNAVKEKEEDNNIDINFIINTFSNYSQKDLYLFRDCIDFLIIYMNR
jgi:hypothetical protein